jgi:hypothetical protein
MIEELRLAQGALGAAAFGRLFPEVAEDDRVPPAPPPRLQDGDDCQRKHAQSDENDRRVAGLHIKRERMKADPR